MSRERNEQFLEGETNGWVDIFHIVIENTSLCLEGLFSHTLAEGLQLILISEKGGY